MQRKIDKKYDVVCVCMLCLFLYLLWKNLSGKHEKLHVFSYSQCVGGWLYGSIILPTKFQL